MAVSIDYSRDFESALAVRLSHRRDTPAGTSVADRPRHPEQLLTVLRRLVSRSFGGPRGGGCEAVHAP